MDLTEPDGFTRRQHLSAADPDNPVLHESCPPGTTHLWSAWADLCRTRGAGWASPSPLTYLELEAWARVKRLRLSPLKAELLVRIDSVFRSVWAEWSKKKDKGEKNG